MMNMDAYKDMAERNSQKDLDENTNDSLSQPGSDRDNNLDSRATLVPPMPGGAGFPSLQMLNLMEKMKEDRSKGGGSEISLTPMNLSTMLSNTGARDIAGLSSVFAQAAERERERRDSSLSPQQRREEEDDVDVDDADGGNDDGARRDRDDGEADSSGRGRIPSGDIRAQFMADLKRLGGNIPAAIIPQNFRGAAANNGSHQEEAASSTTSPPPSSAAAATSSSSLSPPSSAASTTAASLNLSKKSPSEESLPPRKRKVSQEQHAGFNGHEEGGNSGHNSNVSSPEKVSRGGNQSPIPEANEVEAMN